MVVMMVTMLIMVMPVTMVKMVMMMRRVAMITGMVMTRGWFYWTLAESAHVLQWKNEGQETFCSRTQGKTGKVPLCSLGSPWEGVP